MDLKFDIDGDPYKIVVELRTELKDWEIYFLESHPSTQVMAKNAFHNGFGGKGLFLVHNQTNGRGRGVRQWFSSPMGKDITMTILLPIKEIDRNIALMNLIGGISVVEVLRDITGKDFRTKWPNDIFYNDSKVGGILSELLIEKARNAVSMGIGLNVNSSKQDFERGDFMYEIDTVSDIMGVEMDIASIIIKIVKRTKSNMDLMESENFENLQKKWNEVGWRIGKEIKYREFGKDWQPGILNSITPDGYLRIVDKKGDEVTVLIEGDLSK